MIIFVLFFFIFSPSLSQNDLYFQNQYNRIMQGNWGKIISNLAYLEKITESANYF